MITEKTVILSFLLLFVVSMECSGFLGAFYIIRHHAGQQQSLACYTETQSSDNTLHLHASTGNSDLAAGCKC